MYATYAVELWRCVLLFAPQLHRFYPALSIVGNLNADVVEYTYIDLFLLFMLRHGIASRSVVIAASSCSIRDYR